MPPSQHILVYAELLSNIRQISVGCTLPTPATKSSKATIAADGKVLTVAHDGQSQSIQLPGAVASSPTQIPFIIHPTAGGSTKDLSWRLPLASNHLPRKPAGSEDSIPWSAVDLEPGSSVACRTCKSPIVAAGTLRVWKDLPSENWAEMMEFWHCHKPHDHHHHKKHGDDDGQDEQQHLTNRGYGANSRIAAQSGKGFVDLTSFLLAGSDVLESSIFIPTDADCEETSTRPSSTSRILHCASCKAQLGVRNDQESSVSLFKWQVHVNQLHQKNTPESSPTLAQCVSAMLLATMARSGCSKSILLPLKAQSQSQFLPKHEDNTIQSRDLLNIWVFNANITFSSTEAPKSPVNAVKVFYRMVTREEADKMLDSMVSDVQDISLPTEAIATIVELLNASNTFLPRGNHIMEEWSVGLLEKRNGNTV